MTKQIRLLGITLSLLSLSACTGIPTSLGAEPRAGGNAAALARDILPILSEKRIPSVSVAQIQGGEVVLLAAYGEQSSGVPASTASLYNIASMAKPISAEVVLRLASQGAFTLDEPMYPYWADPDIVSDPRHKLLTPRLALSHQTGFASNWRAETGGVLKFKHSPGEAYQYSGEGIEYVAKFAAKRMGTDFESLAQTLVFNPIGMRDTAYTGRRWFQDRIAVPTDGAGKALKPMIAGNYVASDLVYSTAADYAKFMVSLMGDTALSESIAAERKTIQVSKQAKACVDPAKTDFCPLGFGFGLGWEVIRFKDSSYLMHTGMDPGTFTLAYYSPTEKTGAVILTNSSIGYEAVLPILDSLHMNPEFLGFLHREAQE